MDDFAAGERTRLRRLRERGCYDRQSIYDILDRARICHVGIVEQEQPFVIPTIHVRCGDELFLHGAPASRILGHVRGGAKVCVTVTHVDGLVLARSAFHHSLNYRSAMVFGKGRVLSDHEEKIEALRALVEKVTPGRWDEVRAPNEKEMKATQVVAVNIEEASAKIRNGPPVDEEADYKLTVWAGVIPLATVGGTPEADARLAEDTPLAPSAERFLEAHNAAPRSGGGSTDATT